MYRYNSIKKFMKGCAHVAIDAFSTVEYPLLPVKALTPAGIPNIINLNFEAGNSGTTAAVAATLVETIIVPAGVVLTVLDNAGSILNPAGTVLTAGPNSFVFPGITLPGISGSAISLQGFTVTLQVTSGTSPTTIMAITEIVAAGDVNPSNNGAIVEITLR